MGSYDEDKAVIEWALQENQSAISLVDILGGISQTWDDLIDGDACLSDDEINESYENAIIALPRNEFYRQNFLELQPVIEQAVRNWQDANRIESEKLVELYPVSYVIRDSLVDVIIRCSLIIGGKEWASDAAFVLRRQLFDESLEDYIKGLSNVSKIPEAKSTLQ